MSAGFYISDFLADLRDTWSDVFSNIHNSVNDITHSVKENRKLKEIKEKEKKIQEQLIKKFNEVNLESNDNETVKKSIEKIINSFNDCKSFITVTQAKDIVCKEKDVKKQYDICRNLLTLQSKHNMMSNNMELLNDLSEKLDIDIDNILLEYDNIKNEQDFSDLKKIDEYINKFNETLLNKIDSLNEKIEEGIRNKKFDKKFIKFERVPVDILPTIFSSELADMLKNPGNDKTLNKLSNQKASIDLLYKVYELVAVLQDLEGFEDEADRILRLFGSCIKLIDKDDLSFSDFKYEIDLKYSELQNIQNTINAKNKEIFEKKQKFIYLVAENNKLHKYLNMDLNEFEFDEKTYPLVSKQIETENKKLTKEVKQIALARHISTELRRRYVGKNYNYIPVDKEVRNNNSFIHKSYFVTPDGKNVLCLNVNQTGDVSEQIFGVKVSGINDDRKSILEAQEQFCEHNKQIVEEFFKENGSDRKYDDGLITKPSIETAIAINFEGVLPDYVLTQIKEKRLKKTANVQKVRRVQ